MGRKKETSGRGKRPTRRATQRERKESCRREKPNVLPVKLEEGRELQGKAKRQRKSTEEKKTNWAMVGHTPQKGAPWKRHR